jgi:pimeloyl-ACP methyl ester carboxylesterase
VRAGLRRAVYDPATVSEADVDAYYAPLRTAGGTNALVARLRQPTPADRAARVGTIRAPTLVVTGDTDRLVPLETAHAYHALIAGSELLVLERTGHLPQEEQPERVVAEITRWVQVSASRN